MEDAGETGVSELIGSDYLRVLPFAVIVLHASGVITEVNDQAEKLFGYSRDKFLGNRFIQYLPDKFHHQFSQRFSQLFNNRDHAKNPETLMLYGQRRDGTEISIEVAMKLIDTDHPMTAICSIRDMSAETDMIGRLKQTEKELERSIESKARILDCISHDLRQPLQSLDLYLGMLEKSSQSDHPERIHDRMRKNIDSVHQQLDALLNLSRFDLGTVPVKPEEFSLRPLLQNIIASQFHLAEQKNLTLTCTCENHKIYTDPALLNQLVSELVANAIRFTGSGGISIGCRPGRIATQITINDSGSGIPASEQEKVFEEYYQIGNESRSPERGLGLGLAIVQKICNLMDLPLDIFSEPGIGTTFSVQVPNHPGRPNLNYRSTSTSTHPREPVLLLVDDDPVTIEAASTLLEMEGIQVYSAQNAEDALAIIRAGIKPDIVLTDYRLPVYSGVELIRRMREITPEVIPTLIMTGDTSSAVIEEANLADCTILHKPVDPEKLLPLIGQLVEGKIH